MATTRPPAKGFPSAPPPADPWEDASASNCARRSVSRPRPHVASTTVSPARRARAQWAPAMLACRCSTRSRSVKEGAVLRDGEEGTAAAADEDDDDEDEDEDDDV